MTPDDTKEQELQAALALAESKSWLRDQPALKSLGLTHPMDENEALVIHRKVEECLAAAVRELQAERDRLREEAASAEFWKSHAESTNAEFEADYLKIWKAIKQPDLTVVESVFAMKSDLAAAQKRITELEATVAGYRTTYCAQQEKAEAAQAENAALKEQLKGTMQSGGYDYFAGQLKYERERAHNAVYVADQLRAQVEALANAEVLTRDDVMDDETGAWSFIPKLLEGDVCYIVRATPTPKPDAKEDQP